MQIQELYDKTDAIFSDETLMIPKTCPDLQRK